MTFEACPVQPIAIPIPSADGRPLYRVLKTWTYRWHHAGRYHKITVAAGTRFDGASVPRWLWSVSGITPDGLHRAAALAHDVLYSFGGLLPDGAHQVRAEGAVAWENQTRPWSRLQADRLFARILRECGVGKGRRRVMYLAVRAFGGRSWKPRVEEMVGPED